MDTHKAFEGYSARNPVPKVALLLKSIVDPSGATEAKAKNLRSHDKKEEQEQSATAQSTKRMIKGKEVQVKDPVTGQETVRAKHFLRKCG
jgi:hypothetical protein